MIESEVEIRKNKLENKIKKMGWRLETHQKSFNFSIFDTQRGKHAK